MANLNIVNKEWAGTFSPYLATQETMSPSLGEEGDHRTKEQQQQKNGSWLSSSGLPSWIVQPRPTFFPCKK